MLLDEYQDTSVSQRRMLTALFASGDGRGHAVTAVGDHADLTAASKLIVESVVMVDLDDQPELHRLRIYVGYAGWGAGQLDGELEQEAWIVEEAHPDDPFRDGDLWSEVLARKGGEFALLARMPADPSVN